MVTAVAGLVALAPGDAHAAVGDQLRGVVARARQAAADELGVEPEATRRHRLRRLARIGVEGGPKRLVGLLEGREVLLERRVAEPVDVVPGRRRPPARPVWVGSAGS